MQNNAEKEEKMAQTWLHLRTTYRWEALYLDGKKKLEEHEIEKSDLVNFIQKNIKGQFKFTEDYVDEAAVESDKDYEYEYGIEFFPEEITKESIDEFEDFEKYIETHNPKKRE